MNPVKIGNATLYCGDCREILPILPRADLLLTDPPYGINMANRSDGGGVCSAKSGNKTYARAEWDKDRPDAATFALLLNAAKVQIIWGGNYFTDCLPPSMRWLIWDKGQRGFSLADFEMAWTSQDKAGRIFDYPRALAAQDDRVHPTQKPVRLMEWCLSLVPDAAAVLDPFMGSGTTGVACLNMGRAFVGIERERAYFDAACERIARAQAQARLFA